MELKRSKIFPGTQKPKIEGLYERNYGSKRENWRICKYSSGQWFWLTDTPKKQ